MRPRAYSANAWRDAREVFYRASETELFEAAQFNHVDPGGVHVAGIVELNGHLGVALDAGDRLNDECLSHGSPPGHWPQTASASKTVEGCGSIRNLLGIKSDGRKRAHHVHHGIGFLRDWAKATLAWHVGADASRVAVTAAAASTRRWTEAQDALLHQAAHFAQWRSRRELGRIQAALQSSDCFLLTLGGTLVTNTLRCQYRQRLAFEESNQRSRDHLWRGWTSRQIRVHLHNFVDRIDSVSQGGNLLARQAVLLGGHAVTVDFFQQLFS